MKLLWVKPVDWFLPIPVEKFAAGKLTIAMEKSERTNRFISNRKADF
jgi:hypothetical protein